MEHKRSDNSHIHIDFECVKCAESDKKVNRLYARHMAWRYSSFIAARSFFFGGGGAITVKLSHRETHSFRLNWFCCRWHNSFSVVSVAVLCMRTHSNGQSWQRIRCIHRISAVQHFIDLLKVWARDNSKNMRHLFASAFAVFVDIFPSCSLDRRPCHRTHSTHAK